MKLRLAGALALTLLLASAPLMVLAEEDFLYAAESFTEDNGEFGPWYYQSPALTLTTERKRDGEGKEYLLSDIYVGEGVTVTAAASRVGDFHYREAVEPRNIARDNRAVLAFTGDYLLFAPNPKGVMIRDGDVFYDRDEQDTLAVMPDGTLRAFPAGTVRAQELLDMGVKNSFAFGPILVMDGEAYAPALRHALARPNRRCSLGMAQKGHYLQITTVSRFSNAEMQTLYLSLAAQVAYQMDGGQSAVLELMGEQMNAHVFNAELNTYQRPLNDMVVIGYSDLVPKADDPVKYTNLVLH